MLTDERRAKARAMRYKKSIDKELNEADIASRLWEIAEECDELQQDLDNDVLTALDGDNDEENEFKLLAADISAACERLSDNVQPFPDGFDDFFVGIGSAELGVSGYDTYECDFYELDDFETGLARSAARERLMRLTKTELLTAAERCFAVAFTYLELRQKYDSLKAAFDVIKDDNLSLLKTIKELDELYYKGDADGWHSVP